MVNFIKHLFILISILSLASCNSERQKENEGRTIFKYNEMSGVTSLDPASTARFENIWPVNQLFNGLVEMDDSMKTVPAIATSWEISADGKTYTFHLRNDVFFHDDPLFPGGKGRKVTATDFVYSFARLFDSKVSGATSLLNYVDQTSGRKGFSSVNDSTFSISLLKPFTPFLSILTMKYFSVIPREIVDYYGYDFRSHPVGTGPFRFKVWEEENRLVMVRNENYFEKDEQGKSLPYLDAVSVSFIKDKETAFLQFLKGDLDMVSGMDAINKEEVLSKTGLLNEQYSGKINMQSVPFLKTDYLGFFIDENSAQLKNNPVKIKALRQAINYGIDKKHLVKYLRNGLGTPATYGFVPPGLPSFKAGSVKGYEYDPHQAKKMLAIAGFKDGKDLPDIELHTTEQYLDICEFIQSQLQEIGINIKINVDRAAILSEGIASGKVYFFRKSWFVDYPDAENFLSLFYSKNFSPAGFNYTHFKSKYFDDLYEKSLFEQNDSVRYGYYRQMDQLIMDEAPVVPLFYDQVVRLVHKNISGLTPNPVNLLNLKRVKKERKV
jgi:oligopeptide transport system substrate-binding protein